MSLNSRNKSVFDINSWIMKGLIGFITVLLSALTWFITDKMKTFESQFEKLDKVEQKVENLNKSQIQIMTFLKIPVPPYLFSSEQQTPSLPDNNQKPEPVKQYAELSSHNFSVKKNPRGKSKFI